MKLLRLRWRSLRIVAAVGVIAAVLSAGAFVVQEGQALREQVQSGEATIGTLREQVRDRVRPPSRRCGSERSRTRPLSQSYGPLLSKSRSPSAIRRQPPR